jgi:hypothetical protein
VLALAFAVVFTLGAVIGYNSIYRNISVAMLSPAKLHCTAISIACGKVSQSPRSSSRHLAALSHLATPHSIVFATLQFRRADPVEIRATIKLCATK